MSCDAAGRGAIKINRSASNLKSISIIGNAIGNTFETAVLPNKNFPTPVPDLLTCRERTSLAGEDAVAMLRITSGCSS